MTLTKEELKKIYFLVRKSSEIDLKIIENLAKNKLHSNYLKDFNRVRDDVKKTLKTYHKFFLETGHAGISSAMFKRVCLKELKIPLLYLEKAITHLKRSGDIYEPSEELLCPIDSRNIKLLTEQLELIKIAKRKK